MYTRYLFITLRTHMLWEIYKSCVPSAVEQVQTLWNTSHAHFYKNANVVRKATLLWMISWRVHNVFVYYPLDAHAMRDLQKLESLGLTTSPKPVQHITCSILKCTCRQAVPKATSLLTITGLLYKAFVYYPTNARVADDLQKMHSLGLRASPR